MIDIVGQPEPVEAPVVRTEPSKLVVAVSVVCGLAGVVAVTVVRFMLHICIPFAATLVFLWKLPVLVPYVLGPVDPVVTVVVYGVAGPAPCAQAAFHRRGARSLPAEVTGSAAGARGKKGVWKSYPQSLLYGCISYQQFSCCSAGILVAV